MPRKDRPAPVDFPGAGEIESCPVELPRKQTPAKWLSPSSGNEWQSLDLAARPEDEQLSRFQRSVTDILQSQNLVVLCGLGTSMYLKDTNGNRVAPTMTDLWDEVAREATFAEITRQVNYPVEHGDPRKDLELLLSHCQLAEILKPDPAVHAFIERAEQVIVSRCRFVSGSLVLDFHEQFLRKVARRSTRLPRMKLFTTNYDLCFETAASRTRFVVVDGFSHTQPQEFDGSHFDYDLVRRAPNLENPDYITNVFHLYKIHGSVDWRLLKQEQQIHREPNPDRPHLIYPRHTKYESSYDQPFLEMMSRLQIALRQPNTGLLIIGFGFNDFHINQPIMAAIDSNVSLKCMVVSPSLEGHASTHERIRKFAELVKSGDQRISLVAAGFESFVPVIPDLVAYTEEERHRGRLREASLRL